MGKPYSMDLRERAIQAIESGETRESAAERFGISLSTVGRYIRLKRETGQVKPKQFGGYKPYALAKYEGTIRKCLAETPSLTLREIGDLLKRKKKIKVSQGAIFNFLRHLDMPYKKNAARGGARQRRCEGGAAVVVRKPAGT